MSYKIQNLLNATVKHFNLSEADLFVKTRKRMVSEKRMIFFHLVLTSGIRMCELSDFIHKKNYRFNHSTLIYAKEEIKKRKSIYKELQYDIQKIKEISDYIPFVVQDVNLLELTQRYSCNVLNFSI